MFKWGEPYPSSVRKLHMAAGRGHIMPVTRCHRIVRVRSGGGAETRNNEEQHNRSMSRPVAPLEYTECAGGSYRAIAVVHHQAHGFTLHMQRGYSFAGGCKLLSGERVIPAPSGLCHPSALSAKPELS